MLSCIRRLCARVGRAARSDEKGVALLIVIWTLSLLSLLGAGLAADARSEARLVRNLADAARARALAEAGVSLAFYELLTTEPATEWRAGSVTRDVAYEGGRIRIHIEDESGKVDLLRAPDELVANLLDRIGIDGDDRAALLAAIAQRRRAAGRNDAVPTDAEIAAGMPHRARVPPFEALEALVPERSFRLAGRLSAYATVYSESARVDPLTAPAAVLSAVPGMDPSAIEAVIAARAGNGPAPPPPAAALPYLGPGRTPAVRLQVDAVTDNGTSASIEAVAAMSGNPLAPFRVRLWRRGFGADPEAP